MSDESDNESMNSEEKLEYDKEKEIKE